MLRSLFGIIWNSYGCLAARGKSLTALRARLFRRLFVGKPRRFPNRLRFSRLNSTENSQLSPAADFHHGLLVGLLGLSLLQPAHAQDRGLPAAQGTIVVDGSACTLADAIRAANQGTTVGGCVGSPGLDLLQLDANVVLTVAETTDSTLIGGGFAGLPDITSSIVISAGAGDVIERDSALPCGPAEASAFRLFNVLAMGELFLIDLTLRNGCVAPDQGVAEGGAIYVENGLLELNGSTLEGHVAYARGEALGARGGALYCASAGISTVTGTTFQNNLARGADGLEDSSGARGGAAYLSSCSVGPLVESVFEDNSAIAGSNEDEDAQGGALYIADSTLGEVTDTAWTGNLALAGDDDSGRGGRGEGGAVFIVDSTTGVWRGVTLLANQAKSGFSGQSSGQFSYGGGLLVGGTVIDGIEAGLFGNNIAQVGDAPNGDANRVGGGALYLTSGSHIGWIRDSFFAGNQAVGADSIGDSPAEGGAINIRDGSEITEIERVTFAFNQARAGSGGSDLFARGGAVAVNHVVESMFNCTFYGNRAIGGDYVNPTPGDAGGEASGGALFLSLEDSIELYGNTFVDNEAQAGAGDMDSGIRRGGGFWLDESSVPIHMVGNLLTGNLTAGSDGVAVHEDCGRDPLAWITGSHNFVEAPGNCPFFSIGDQIGAATSVYELADYGCQTTLPGGICVPTLAIDQDSPAVDAGSCSSAVIAVDAREFVRPFDLGAVADIDDGCDIGAFEAVDSDGDGFTEVADCAPDDPSANAIDLCGVCGGDNSSCSIFIDGFESGDTSAWSI